MLALTASPVTSAKAETRKTTTATPPGLAAPDKTGTRPGALQLFDGFPDEAVVEKLYDNLDFQRAAQSNQLAIPAVNQAAMRKALLTPYAWMTEKT